MVPVHAVHDLTAEETLRAARTGADQGRRPRRGPDRALRLAEIFRANVVDSTLESFVFEMTGTPDKIDAFAEELMRPLGLVGRPDRRGGAVAGQITTPEEYMKKAGGNAGGAGLGPREPCRPFFQKRRHALAEVVGLAHAALQLGLQRQLGWQVIGQRRRAASGRHRPPSGLGPDGRRALAHGRQSGRRPPPA